MKHGRKKAAYIALLLLISLPAMLSAIPGVAVYQLQAPAIPEQTAQTVDNLVFSFIKELKTYTIFDVRNESAPVDFPKNPAISKVFREIGLADELGSGMRNTYKYTRLYSGVDPLFEEGDIFRTIIPLKKIATQKVGGSGVAQDVAHSVAQDVAHDKIALAEFIKEKIRGNNKITRKAIADEAGVSVKTIERTIKEMDNLQYVGSGSNGHWELNE